MRSATFWHFFDTEAAPKLMHRADTFRKTFDYLDRLNRPIGIVETGCARTKDNWRGDGESTLLFDHYVKNHAGSLVFSVDIDATATALCKSMVSDRVKVHTGDSVKFLDGLVQHHPSEMPTIDLLYLDSFDVDLYAPWPSAIHHFKELMAISPLLSPQTLVVVDDSPSMGFGYVDNSEFVTFPYKPRIGGKGLLIADYADAIGVHPYFTGYQCGWIGLKRQA
jgi:hypothetical protein